MPKVLSASWISSGLLSEKAIDEEAPHRCRAALNRINATVHRTGTRFVKDIFHQSTNFYGGYRTDLV